MTKEEAIKELSVQYLGDSDRMREAKDVAMSALSTEGEYIKKEEIINHLTELGWISDEPFNEVAIPKEVFDEVPTYSFPNFENKGEFDGMTNGEVLKSIFPTAELMLGNSDYIPNVFSIKEDWWNAPYQKGGDDKECI